MSVRIFFNVFTSFCRCPAGFSSWAANFIQLPVPYEGSHHDQAYLDHFIAVLAGVLLPINSREQFLQVGIFSSNQMCELYSRILIPPMWVELTLDR